MMLSMQYFARNIRSFRRVPSCGANNIAFFCQCPTRTTKSFSSFSANSTVKKPRRARVALVGSGRMGQIRASLLYASPRFDLAAVVDLNYEGAEMLSEEYSAEPFKTLPEAIHAKPLDGIIISTPTFTHESAINDAASHGLSIFTEKPVDETADKIESLFKTCNEAGVSLCCGFQRRFDESYVTVARAVHDGQIGKPITSSIFFADHPSPPIEFLLTGGNIFYDLSAHDIDYIRWVLNDEVASVFATGTSSTKVLEDAGVHDNATVVMKFQKGAVVTLCMSRSASYGYDQRCEVFGEKGLLAVGNEHANTAILSNKSGIHHSNLKYSFPQRFNQAFGAELDAFADVLQNGAEWPITENDCIAVQKVSDAARLSCDLGQVVEIPADNYRTDISAAAVVG